MGYNVAITDESFKYYTGTLFDSTMSQIKNYPTSLWDKIPNRTPVPYGKDLFTDSKYKSISLSVGQNDRAVFQIAFKADENYILSLNTNTVLSPSVYYTNYRIDVDCVTIGDAKLSIEGMVFDDDRMQKADILLETSYKEYQAREVSMVYAEINTPKGCDAGKHKGVVRVFKSFMFEDEELIEELEFVIDVRNVVLPDARDNKFFINLWQHLSNIGRQHEVTLWSEGHLEVLENYVATMAPLGQKVISIMASDIPWAGQYCHRVSSNLSDMFEYNMIKTYKGEDGKFYCDYTTMQKYIDICFKHGIDQIIEVFGLLNVWVDEEFFMGYPAADYPDGVKIRYYDCTTKTMKVMRSGAEIEWYIKSLQDYFVDVNLIDKVKISTDEPMDYDYFKVIMDRVKKVAPKFRFAAAICHTSHIAKTKDDVDFFTIILPYLAEGYDEVFEYKKDTSKIYSWYVCCGPKYPNQHLKSHLLETRAIAFISDYLGVQGFTRWDYAIQPKDPRANLSWHLYNAGDGNFVYPAANGKPMLSLRYKMLQRTFEDGALIQMLRDKDETRADVIMTEVRKVIFKKDTIKEMFKCDTDASNEFVLDNDAYEKAKVMLLDELEK